MLRLLLVCLLTMPLISCANRELIDTTVGAIEAKSVAYSLQPHLTGNTFDAVDVGMIFNGDEDGQTVLELPGEFAGQTELWRHVSALHVNGATVTELNAATRLLTHRPGAAISVRYRVASAYGETPTAYAKGGAIIRPDWFASFGEALFASVDGRENDAATFKWQDWPASWNIISDLDHGQMGRAMTSDDIVESTLLAGPEVQTFERTIPNGMLRLGIRGAFDFDTADYVEALTEVIGAQRKFWGDAEGPFTVTLYALKGISTGSSAGGTGRSDGFALEATPDIDLPNLTRIIAHEHTHTWIPRRVGEFPEADEALSYWFSEGVTDFYTGRTLVGTGVWTPDQFVDDLNEALVRYAGSPAHDVPNSEIAKGFWTDDNVQQLPYDRGRLFAYLIDYQIRNTSDDKFNYDDLLEIMRDRWRAAPVGAKPELRQAFEVAATQLDIDVDPLLKNYIDDGVTIFLPSDQFGQCATVQTVQSKAFEPGFDRTMSSDTGIISGVVSDSPAERAGLRDGMRRVAYVTSKEGDSRAPMAYRIEDAKGERVVSWLPAGDRVYVAQEVVATGDTGTEVCARIFGGKKRVSGS